MILLLNNYLKNKDKYDFEEILVVLSDSKYEKSLVAMKNIFNISNKNIKEEIFDLLNKLAKYDIDKIIKITKNIL